MSLSELTAAVPEPARAAVTAAVTVDGALPARCRGVFCDVGEDAVAVYLVFDMAFQRVEVTRSGATRTTTVPLTAVRRIDEIADAQGLTVVVELDADAQTIAVVAATIDGRLDAQGSMLRNGYVLVAQGPARSALGAFAAAVRLRLVAPARKSG